MKEYYNYLVDEYGNVFSKYKQRQLKLHDNNGYRMVFLKLEDGKAKWRYVHRLVAELYLPVPPPHHTDVNHLDGNKANNHYSNIEWCTKSMNTIHAIKTGLLKPKGAVGFNPSEETRKLMSDKKKGKLHPRHKYTFVTPNGTFDSMQDACKANNTYPQKIRRYALAGVNGYSLL